MAQGEQAAAREISVALVEAENPGSQSGPAADRSAIESGVPQRRDDQSELAELDPELVDLFEQVTRWLQSGAAVDEDRLVADHPAWTQEIHSLLPTLRGMACAGELGKKELDSPPTVERDSEGRRIVGDFRIVREIGRGGMGIVYEAQQASLGRRVALKVLPSVTALDPRAFQRFQLEAQVAGWLQHSRIVPVYAVGVANEVPYFAMQYIEGGSLRDLIEKLKELVAGADNTVTANPSDDGSSVLALGMLSGRFAPSPRDSGTERRQAMGTVGAETQGRHPDRGEQRSIRGAVYLRTIARLGTQAAHALGHAHEQGIVHRDVKPANLLLDRNGDVWVADFGMADVDGDAGVTLSGDLPGTLRYMSPEQARGQRALVDRRTDIYSLGATLYELLTLQPAVTGNDKVEIIRRITEEEPVPVRRLNLAVPVDLATIVTKALSKESSNRYETAVALADDLDRFLEGRPIAARPIGPLSRTWRWCRRKPVQAGLVAALAFAVVTGFAGITWNWRDAVLQKRETERQKSLLAVAKSEAVASEKKALLQAAKADAINHFLVDKLLRQASPENNPAAMHVTLLEVLDHAAEQVGRSFPGQPEIETAIRLAIGETYHDLGAYAKSEAQFRGARDLCAVQSDETSSESFRAEVLLGHNLVHLGRLDEAEAMLADAIRRLERTRGPDDDLTLEARGFIANLHQKQGRPTDAEVLYRQLVDHYRRAGVSKGPDAITTMNNLGTVLEEQRKYVEAERLFRESLTLGREILGTRHPKTIAHLHNLAYVLNKMGRVEESATIMRESFELSRELLGPEHPTTLMTMSTLGSLLTRLKRLDEAEQLLRPCLEADRRVFGANSAQVSQTSAFLDDVLKARSRQTKGASPPTTGPSKQ
jgi:serine/threonine protein kinase/tetratricopeptide (TPR) repeat protein